MKERRASQKLSSKSIMDPNQNVKCKIVVVGDSQCGKTALLHVFAKDCFPENYVPTVFENYTASFEIDTQRIELSLWDTSEDSSRGKMLSFSGRGDDGGDCGLGARRTLCLGVTLLEQPPVAAWPVLSVLGAVPDQAARVAGCWCMPSSVEPSL
ncbi:Rho-related GTP-binding protein RhoE [Microtus ochrogaster]|uniref:Rho-related GTP-binding protein RhoE n=1 Tax=Microtus ochrogaster TaxID=79684 RepID=A0A8J6FVL2_MICOH|nr:Rho-related GTP-binding protein RhoE [Microtus ochrogaster]